MRCLHPTEKAHFCMRSHERVEAQTSHRRWHIVDSMQAEAQPERSLEPAAAKAMSLERVGCGKSPPNPSSIHQVESIQSVGSFGSVGSVGSIASIHSK